MADIEEKVEQYKAYLQKYYDNPKEEKILYVFKKLDRLEIDLEILQKTGVGKVVNSFRKHEGTIGEKARALVGKWKQLLNASNENPVPTAPPAQQAVSFSGLSTETVSETTYGSHSGRLTQRLDEMESYGNVTVKTEPASVRVKEEPREEDKKKSRSSSSKEKSQKSQSERSRKRESSPDDKSHKRHKGSHGEDKHESVKADLVNIKKEKMEREKVRIKKEPKDSLSVRTAVKEESVSPAASPAKNDMYSRIDDMTHKETSHKDQDRSSSHKVDKLDKPSSRDNHHRSKSSSSSSRDKSSRDKGSHSSSTSSSNTLDKVKVKSEPQEKSRSANSSSSSSLHRDNKVKVKTEKVDREKSYHAMSPDPDFEPDKTGAEQIDNGHQKSKRPDEKSHKKDQLHSSSSHSSKRKSHSSSSRESESKTPSSSSSSRDKKDKHSSSSSKKKDKDKSASSTSLSERKHKSSSSSSKHSGSSSAKKSKKLPVIEFDMFSMPNGVREDSSGDDDDEMNGASFEDMLMGNNNNNNVQKKSAIKVKTEKPESSSSSSLKSSSMKIKTEKPDAATPSSSAARPISKKFLNCSVRAKVPPGSVPLPQKNVSLTQDDILGALPEITPNYKPLPRGFEFEMGEKQLGTGMEPDFASKKSRTTVYSGRRNIFLRSVPTLYNSCLQVLKDNIDALDFVGGVPYDIMKPVLEICTPAQLYNLEDANPQFIGDTDELWKEHCKKDFRNHKPDEFESWREMFIRCHDARDAKLKSLTSTIKASVQKAKEPVRTAKLAYVDTAAKAPRDVRRKQRMHGTAGPIKQDPLMKLSSHRTSGQPVPRAPIPRSTDPNTSSSLARPRGQDKSIKPIAPMMRKTLRFMKSLKRK